MSAHASGLTATAGASNLRVMSFLLPQTREATVLQVRAVSLHGDRYLDLVLRVDEPGSAPLSVRLGAAECPADLVEGDVEPRIVALVFGCSRGDQRFRGDAVLPCADHDGRGGEDRAELAETQPPGLSNRPGIRP